MAIVDNHQRHFSIIRDHLAFVFEHTHRPQLSSLHDCNASGESPVSTASARTSVMATTRDVPLLITSTASSSERRITPSWTIAHLKTKLEPVTGVPPASQRLTLRLPDQQQEIAIEAEDEESVQVGRWPLVAYAELKVLSSFKYFDAVLVLPDY